MRSNCVHCSGWGPDLPAEVVSATLLCSHCQKEYPYTGISIQQPERQVQAPNGGEKREEKPKQNGTNNNVHVNGIAVNDNQEQPNQEEAPKSPTQQGSIKVERNLWPTPEPADDPPTHRQPSPARVRKPVDKLLSPGRHGHSPNSQRHKQSKGGNAASDREQQQQRVRTNCPRCRVLLSAPPSQTVSCYKCRHIFHSPSIDVARQRFGPRHSHTGGSPLKHQTQQQQHNPYNNENQSNGDKRGGNAEFRRAQSASAAVTVPKGAPWTREQLQRDVNGDERDGSGDVKQEGIVSLTDSGRITIEVSQGTLVGRQDIVSLAKQAQENGSSIKVADITIPQSPEPSERDERKLRWSSRSSRSRSRRRSSVTGA